MWSDNESEYDFLGFQHLVGAITSIVRNDSLLPTTIGVYGDWGSGKTSLIKMVENGLKDDDGIEVLSFNGWLFEGYEDARTALMGSVLEELLEQRKFLAKLGDTKDKIIGKFRKLLWRVDKIKAAKSIAKLTIAAMAQDYISLISGASGVADLVSAGKVIAGEAKDAGLDDVLGDEEKEEKQSLRRSIRDFRKDFGELLKESKIKTLVITIDDLDRCNPDTIIETLEAIKLFLFVDRTVFIIGADERLVRYAVRRRFPELPGEKTEVGRDYLEKLIQFPVRIPSLGRNEMESYINILFTNLSELSPDQKQQARQAVIECEAESLFGVNFNLAKVRQLFGDVPAELSESLEMAQRIAPLLASGLNGNPRQCKRFLNMLLMRIAMANSRKQILKQRILAKLMLLEYFKPEFFRKLAIVQGKENGFPSQLRLLERDASANVAGESPDQEVAATTPEKQGSETSKGRKEAKVAEGQSERIQTLSAVQVIRPDAEFQNWLVDSWTKDWLKMSPSLSDEDLRPYFFFSRDTLGALTGAVQRMSPAAQDALNNILSQSEACRNNGLKAAASLSMADAAALFEALVTRVEEEEDRGAEDSMFFRLFKLVGARRDLCSQMIQFLEGLTETTIPIAAVAKVEEVCKDTETDPSARQLLRRWAQNTSNTQLANIATPRLEAWERRRK